jgi:hypothetical protein
VVTGDLPWPDDLNCPTGAKIWLVNDAHADCTGARILTTWSPASYLFDAADETDWVKFDDLSQADVPCNEAPVAEAGPDQDVDLGDLVTLDGSGSSDPEDDPLTYTWVLDAKPAGSAAVLANPATVSPSFTADKVGDYFIKLVVYDGDKDSVEDWVTVTATAPTTTVNLCEKNTSWTCKSGGATATLTYNTIGNPDFDYSVAGVGLVASTDYTLIYYPDPWPGTGLICFDSGVSDSGGALSFTGTATPGDLPQTCDDNCGTGAKMWLVPTVHLNCGAQTMSWCNPGQSCTQILFDDQGTDLINFDDLSDEPGSCVGGGC